MTVCPIAKKKILPFSSSTHVSNLPFDLIHCDLWGPFSTLTIDGYKYFLTIVDDFSRCTWIYLMKTKSELRFYCHNFMLLLKLSLIGK